jgi:cytochrome c-type biogenesis protein CcmH/NrfF
MSAAAIAKVAAICRMFFHLFASTNWGLEDTDAPFRVAKHLGHVPFGYCGCGRGIASRDSWCKPTTTGRLSLYALRCALLWETIVAIHASEAALHVRSEIDGAVQAGRSDEEIKEILIREYGHGILMNPEGIRGIVVYTVPFLVLATGLLLVIVWMKKAAPVHFWYRLTGASCKTKRHTDELNLKRIGSKSEKTAQNKSGKGCPDIDLWTTPIK